jgi:hypothetical protein
MPSLIREQPHPRGEHEGCYAGTSATKDGISNSQRAAEARLSPSLGTFAMAPSRPSFAK